MGLSGTKRRTGSGSPRCVATDIQPESVDLCPSLSVETLKPHLFKTCGAVWACSGFGPFGFGMDLDSVVSLHPAGSPRSSRGGGR